MPLPFSYFYFPALWYSEFSQELLNYFVLGKTQIDFHIHFIDYKSKVKPFCKKSNAFSSVQISLSVVSDSLLTHESQHARPPCPSPTLEFTQTHVHWVCDAIQPYHPLSSPSPPAPSPSQHQGLFQWVSSSNEVAKVLEFQLQHQSFQWTPRTGLL